MNPDTEQRIRRAARAAGIPEETAMAYAERESSGNPFARSSKTMHGLYQMSGPLRQQYGVGDSVDPEVQTQGFAGLLKDNKAVMAKSLGRDPTDSEAYLGHHFGAGRGARVIQMDPNTPVQSVFSPLELSQNPHIVKAGTTGQLASSLIGDMDSRIAKHGGGAMDFSGQAQPMDFSGPAKTPEPMDFSSQVSMQ